jgi:hypothetical protein
VSYSKQLRLSVCLAALIAMPAYPCSVISKPKSAEMVKSAEVIVRAFATGYQTPPHSEMWTTGTPDSRIVFKVVETIRGAALPEVILPGYLVQTDDFNDQPPPYTFVRPGGRDGSCFANSYRSGGEFLLLLVHDESGKLTTNWYALGPVNEQLHSETDPWLLWVRAEAKRSGPGSAKKQ